MRNTLTALALGFAICFAGTYMLLVQVFPPVYLSVLSKSIISGLDALIIMLPMLFLPPRWRRLAVVPCLLMPVLLWCNLLYARNFGHPIPAYGYGQTSGVGHFVWHSALASMRAVDSLLALLGIAACAWALARGRAMAHEPAFSLRFRLVWSVALVLVWVSAFVLSVRRIRYAAPHLTMADALELRAGDLTEGVSWRASLGNGGFTEYLAAVAWQLSRRSVTLTETDRRDIAARFAEPAAGVKPAPASRNLVLIIVESLNSMVTRRPEFPLLMPTLHALMQDSDAVLCTTIQPQVDVGRSSDGQFIINTGLLPLRGESHTARFAQADYPSLVKAIRPASSMEVIGETRALYSHAITSRSYGYDSISDNNMSLTNGFNSDALILRRALHVADSLPQPFLLEVTTLTTHDPFLELDPLCCVELADTLSLPLRSYLHGMHRFDQALGEFVDSLRARGLWHNTVLAITSDHDVRDPYIEPAGGDIMLLVVNSGAGPVEVEGRRRQTDVFPTLLDVMGVGSSYVPSRLGRVYRGLGHSMLLPPVEQSDSDIILSEKMIRGRFFQP